MRTLPLYPDRPVMPAEPASLIEEARARLGEEAVQVLGWEGLSVDPGCTRCDLHARPRTKVCLPPDGEPGGLLVVGEHPTMEDNAQGRPFTSAGGRFLRLQVAKHWTGPVAWDMAVKCHPGKLGLKDKHVAQCLPYLRRTIEEVRPTRILAVGGWATYAVTGRAFPVMSTRKGYGYTSGGVPVFYLSPPSMALKNRFVRAWLEEDVAWALTCPPPALPPWDAVFRVVETIEDALVAASALMEEATEGRALAFDCETRGWQRCPGFEVVTLAVCPVGLDEAWVWPREALEPGDPRVEPLLKILRDPAVAKAGSNVKYDNLSIADRFGGRVAGITGDALFFRKMQWSDAAGDLDTMAELVGMGGHKAEAQVALATIGKIIKTAKGTDHPDPEFRAATAAVQLGEPYERYAYGLMEPTLRSRYCARDAVATARLIAVQEPELRARPATWAFWEQHIGRHARAFEQIEAWGIAASFDAAEDFRVHVQTRLDPIVAEFAALKLNPNSGLQLGKLLFEDLKLPVLKRTPAGKPSVDEEVLEHLKGRAPICARIVEYRQLDKLRSTYAEPLPRHVRADGRVHANFKVDGTRTGRISCIAGWCLVCTQRGAVRMDEVVVGDYVWTHRERWRQVTRTLRQGVRQTIDMCLSSGEVLSCTTDHPLLGMFGWKEAMAYARKSEVDRRECISGDGAVSISGEPNLSSDRGSFGYAHRQRGASTIPASIVGGIQGAEVFEVFCEQDRRQEPDAWEGRRSASSLERGVRRRAGVLDHPVDGEAPLRSRRSFHGSARGDGAASQDGSAPCEWGQEGQSPRQPGVADEGGTWQRALFAGEGRGFVTVEEIHFGQRVEVHDLSVAEDQSFMVCGVFAHNCTEPNLQNFPGVGTPMGKMARDCFIAEPGKILVEGDFSQIELRIAAMLSGDPLMIEIFKSGVDYHLRTAQMVAPLVWGIGPEDVTDEHRRLAKPVNFGLLYGLADAALAAQVGCTIKQASALRAAILGRFKGLAKWMSDRQAETQRTGVSWTWWDGERARCRSLWAIGDQDSNGYSVAFNSAVNAPVQGTASEFCLESVTMLVEWILAEGLEEDVKLVLTVHDSIMMEARSELVPMVAQKMRDVMTGWNSMGVPLAVDFKVGPAWGSMEKYKVAA